MPSWPNGKLRGITRSDSVLKKWKNCPNKESLYIMAGQM